MAGRHGPGCGCASCVLAIEIMAQEAMRRMNLDPDLKARLDEVDAEERANEEEL